VNVKIGLRRKRGEFVDLKNSENEADMVGCGN